MTIFFSILYCTILAVLFIGMIYLITCDKISIKLTTKHAYKKEQEVVIEFKGYPYRCKKVKNFPTITFAQFKDFYAINPDSWTLRDCRVFKNYDDEMSFTFTHEEWKKYVKFKKQIEKEKAQQKILKEHQRITKEQNEITRKILEAVQEDINNIYKEQAKNMAEAANLIKEVNL